MTLTGSCTDRPDAEVSWTGAKGNTAFASSSLDETSSGTSNARSASWLMHIPGLRRFEKVSAGSAVKTIKRAHHIAPEHAFSWPHLPGSIASSVRWMRDMVRNGAPDENGSVPHRRTAFHQMPDGGAERGGKGVVAHPQVKAVLVAMDALPPELRDALALVVIHGLSYQEAADRQGVPVACLNSRVARARAKLAEEIGLLSSRPETRS